MTTFKNQSFRQALALGILIAIAFTEVVYLNLTRYWSLSVPMGDLATMTQAIWSVLHGKPLVITVHDGVPYSRLLGHAELIYLLIAPILKLFPSAATLLVIEAAVYASAAVPVYRLGNLYGRRGLWLAFAYLFYPVGQTGVLMEFHADPLAMAFLLWAMDAMERKRWKTFGVWIALTLLCKVYMAAPVLLIALLLWRRGEKRAALTTGGAATLWGIFITLGLKVIVAPYFHTAPTRAIEDYVAFRYGSLLQVLKQTWLERIITAFIVFFPVLPWLPDALLEFTLAFMLSIPVLLTSLGTFRYYYHHYPIVVAFTIYALAIASLSHHFWKKIWTNFTIVLMHFGLVFGVLFVFFLPSLPWRNPLPRERGHRVVSWANSLITQNAQLAASGNLVYFFALRPWVAELTYPIPKATLSHSDTALIDLFQEGNYPPLTPAEQKIFIDMLHSKKWVLKDLYDGVLLLSAQHDSEKLPWRITTTVKESINSLCGSAYHPIQITPSVRLLCYHAEQGTQNNTVGVKFVWLATAVPQQNAMPITSVGGWVPAGERLPHFPIWGAYPLPQWQVGQVIVEEMTWRLHLPPGCYPVTVGLYNVARRAYPLTADSNLVGKRVPLGAFQVETDGSVHYKSGCAR